MKMWKYHLRYIGRNIKILSLIKIGFFSLGPLWSLYEGMEYIFPNNGFNKILKSLWFIFPIVGIIIQAVKNYPRHVFRQKLNGRDVSIEIIIGDIMKCDGSIIISSNTTFDIAIPEIISKNSIQGQFTEKYYSTYHELASAIDRELSKEVFTQLQDNRIGRKKRYDIGTVVKLEPKGKTAYFLAIAHINEHGVAKGTFEDLRIALTKLWTFIGQRAEKCCLAVPIIGSGFARLREPRDLIIREIIKSFIVACSESVICDKLKIIITPKDIIEHNIDVNKLNQFLQHECTYNEFSNNLSTYGTPI